MLTKSIKSFFSSYHTPICIVGGGTAGLNLTAQLIQAKGNIKIIILKEFNHIK